MHRSDCMSHGTGFSKVIVIVREEDLENFTNLVSNEFAGKLAVLHAQAHLHNNVHDAVSLMFCADRMGVV